MTTEQQISELSAIVQREPNNIMARNRLGLLLYPITLANWPAMDRSDNIEELQVFYQNVAKPIYDLLQGIESVEVADYYFRISGLLHWIGDNDRSLEYVKEALKINTNITSKHKLSNSKIRFFQTRTGIRTQFGHLIHEPDCYVRRTELGWEEPIRPVVLIPNRKCANTELLAYWQRHLCVISNPYLCTKLEKLARELEYNSYWLEVPDIGIRYGHSGVIACTTSWEQEKKPPVLSLKSKQIKDGRELLKQIGVPGDAWFVATHCRSSQTNHADANSPRNSKVESYYESYKRITDKGGYIIRLGNETMPRLPNLEKVIDLSQYQDLPEWFDLFAISQCKFFLGSASGPGSLAAPFSTPHLMTNIPANCFTVSPKDLFLPKLLRYKNSKKLLTFRELFTSKYQYIFNPGIYDKLGVEVVDNEPDELAEAADEMLNILNGSVSYSDEDIYLLRRFEALASALEGRAIKCRVSAYFARKYKDLLLG